MQHARYGVTGKLCTDARSRAAHAGCEEQTVKETLRECLF